MSHSHRSRSSAAALARSLPIQAAIAAVILAACDPGRALEVEDVDVLDPATVNSKGALPALRNGVLSSFQVAFSGAADQANGGHEGQVNISALLADEFFNAETFPDRLAVDQRSILASNGAVQALFLDLSRARAAADLASSKYTQFDSGTEGHSEVLSIGAYAYLLFAENFCSGVPFSRLTDSGIEYGQPQTRDEILQIALAKLDSAITFAGEAQNTRLLNLARVGKGRALLNLNRPADAAAAVTAVPTTYAYEIEGSANSTRQNNGIWNYTVNTFSFTVANREGGNGLNFASAADPRVPVANTGEPGFDGETLMLLQLKYPDKEANVELASGVEARLIEAEAALRAGNVGAMTTTLNGLRVAGGLGTLTAPANDVAGVDLLFRERAFWLFLTSHRLGDLRRLVRQYGRAQNTVFPTGEYPKGGVYGSDVNFPVSSDERNNPNFSACLDREA